MNDNFKFKTVLQAKVDRDKYKKEKEDLLRKEYGAEEHMVEIKTSKVCLAASIWSMLKDILKSITMVTLLLLASVGLVAILHPEIRNIIIQIGVETMVRIRTSVI